MASKHDRPNRSEDASAGISRPAQVAQPGRRARAEVFATVFATGLAVMVVEILGTRIIGPVFGVSLFVWSALLAVTLASLAVGYYVGGVLIDRSPDRRVLSLAVVVSGALLGATPIISHGVLSLSDGLGPRLGSLIAATLLFAPGLAVLGTAGPIAIRLATEDLRAAGHRAGSVYAISTAGSLVGTLLTGFFLIPNFETNQILFGTALLLILLGAVPLAARRRPAALVSLAVPLIALATPSPALPSGLSIVARGHSPYGLIEVVDDQNRGIRLMRADHSIIGGQAMSDRSSVFAFLHALESLRFLRPQARDMLQIGLGIGSLPMALRPYGIRTDAVEIDPIVARFAEEHFGFAADGKVYIEDARTFLNRGERQYDLIVHDTFTGGATPDHLLSVEVLQRIRGLLRPGGALALNFVGYADGPRAAAAWAVARTVRATFRNVRVFRDDGSASSAHGLSNLLFFASNSPLQFSIPEDAKFENEICKRALRSFTGWEVLQTVPPGPLITDDHNPLARLQLPINEEHSRNMKELLPAEFWRRY